MQEAGLFEGMARPESQLGVPGGVATLKPAFAGFGRNEGQAASELSGPVANMIPVRGSLHPASEVVRANDCIPSRSPRRLAALNYQEVRLWSG